MRRLLICLAIAGCARAGKENSIVGGLVDAGPRRDGGGDGDAPDASLVDAPPQQVTLTQTTSDAVAAGGSRLGCNMSGLTRENSYYRVFTLADDRIATTLHVTEVAFGIDTAVGGTRGSQPATVRIGTYGGTPGSATLDLSLVRTIDSVDIQIPDGSGTTMTVPITGDVAPGANLIVELFIPDGSQGGDQGNQFWVGVNASGERQPGYLRGPGCSIPDPIPMQSLAQGHMVDDFDLILAVTGITDVPS